PAQLAHELDVVVSRDGERTPGGDHRHGATERVRDSRTAVDQVTEEDDASALRVRAGSTPAARRVAELVEQRVELLEAAVHVADHVERPVVVAAVVPEPLALDRRALDLLDRREHDHVPEALPLETAQRATEVARLAPYDVRTEVASRPVAVALVAHLLWHVE